MIKTKTLKLGGYKRTVTKESDPKNYKAGMGAVTYANKNIPIKKTKTVVIETPKKTVTKVKSFSPINYYGKQTKTVTKSIKRK